MRRLAIVVVCVVTITAAALPAQTSQPLPDRTSFLRATQDNLARAQREQWRYAYKERRTELHTNPFGKIGTDGIRLYEVTPGPRPGVLFRRLLEKDGEPVAGARPERQERRERPQPRPVVEDVVDTLAFAMDRREVRNGRDMIVVTFAARPEARPQTREGRMAKIFSGTIWIDEAAHEVAYVEATATDSISYGLGVIARLNEGTRVSLTREPVDHIWLPTGLRLAGQGRAILFRRLTIDFAVDWFDYRLAVKD